MMWNTPQGKALLRAAYPDGYLAMRGVRTLGGCLCLEPPDGDIAPTFYVLSSFNTREGMIEAVEDDRRLLAGDLLPLPDPSDAATWACLKEDLANALGVGEEHSVLRRDRSETEITWCVHPELDWDDVPTGNLLWILHCEKPRSIGALAMRQHGTFCINTNDPATALIQARATLVPKHGR